MATHNETGIAGEKMAREYLEKKGFEILRQNWRKGRCEVDLIYKDKSAVVFVEVKTRSSNYFGYPEISVDEKKKQMLAKAAGLFLEEIELDCEVRFDIISVTMGKAEPEILHIEDAFFLHS